MVAILWNDIHHFVIYLLTLYVVQSYSITFNDLMIVSNIMAYIPVSGQRPRNKQRNQHSLLGNRFLTKNNRRPLLKNG
jgi:hypothetical protein